MNKKEEQTARLRALYAELPSTYKKEEIIKEEIMLPMEDGVRLRTVFWKPKGVKALSVIVTRSCYPSQEAEMEVHGEECALRGFGFVVQWCRGTNGSEGQWEPNTYERQDGLCTMEYLSKKKEIKNIGYWGNSYLASTGWCMADKVPEKVKSMYLGVYGTDRYVSVYQDGLFRQDIFTWWSMENAGVPITADYLQSCRYRPQTEVDEALWGTRLPWYRDWITNTDEDSDYWSRKGFWRMMRDIPQKTKIPVFIREGWYDHHLGSAAVTWERLGKESKEHSTLQIGPWRHFYDYVLEGQKTENIKDDSVSSVLSWFEETLKKERKPEKKCELYVIGADRWITVRDPKELDTKEIILHLDAAEGKKEAGRLKSSPGKTGKVSYIYDPEDPVPSHGTESCFKSRKEIGSLFQPKEGYREDVASFVSEPLEEPVTILGKMEVCLWVSSDAEDTAFTAKIMEVFADGSCVNIRGSITTLAYRNGSVKRQAYRPNDKVMVRIEMWPVGWRTKKGSRLRVDISSSDFPQYAVHTNYPGIWSRQEKSKRAGQTIYTGEGQDSCLKIPAADIDHLSNK